MHSSFELFNNIGLKEFSEINIKIKIFFCYLLLNVIKGNKSFYRRALGIIINVFVFYYLLQEHYHVSVFFIHYSFQKKYCNKYNVRYIELFEYLSASRYLYCKQ